MRAITAEDVLALERIGEPVLSPDGAWIVAAVAKEDLEANRSFSRLCVFDAEGARPARDLTDGTYNDDAPAWSPDGKKIAFVSKRGDDAAPQVYVINADGGDAVRLTAIDGGALVPKWMPDGRRLIFLGWQSLVPAQALPTSGMVWDRGPVAHWDHYLPPRRLTLFALDVETRAVRDLLPRSEVAVEFRLPAPLQYSIAPDGGEIAFAGQTDASGLRPNIDIYVVSIATGAVRNVSAANAAADQAPTYSPDGRHLAWMANTIPGTIGRCAPDCERVVVRERPPGGPTPSDGAPRVLTAGWDAHARAIVWEQASRSLLCIAEDRPTRRVFRINLDGQAPVALTDASDFTGLAVEGPRAVALRASLSEPPTIVALDTAAGTVSTLSRLNDRRLAEAALGEVESVTYRGSSGAAVQMWVVKPPGFDASRRYPLLLLLHGGPFFAITDQWAFRWNAQVFAGWGYVVAWHNFHGSSGFGEEFAKSILHDRMTAPYEDTIAAARWSEAQPWIDRERMVAAGGSFGGFLACTILGRPHPFKALVAHAPVYDQYTQEGADYACAIGTALSFEGHKHLQDNSPHMHDEAFATPTLIIHGLKDLRVPASQSIELFHTLQKRGVPSRLVLYPDENHHILLPRNVLHWHAQVRAWVERYAPPGAQ